MSIDKSSTQEYSHHAHFDIDNEKENLGNKKNLSLIQSMRKVSSNFFHFQINTNKTNKRQSRFHPRISHFKKRSVIYNFLKYPSGKLAKSYHIFITALIFACLLLTILSSIKELKNSKTINVILYVADALALATFLTEYLVRFWSSSCVYRYWGLKGKLRFLVNPFRVVDLIVIISSGLLVTVYLKDGLLNPLLNAFRFLQTFKMLRLEQQFRPWRVMASVIWSQREHLYITTYTSFLALIFTSFLIYYVEKDSNPNFSNLGQTLWWTVVTLCTVGYGDIYPITTAGKFLACICIIIGVSLFALPAGILGTGLALKVQETQRMRQKGKQKVPAANLIESKWRCHQILNNRKKISVFQVSAKTHKMSTKLLTKSEEIWLKFILKTKYFVARKKFAQTLKPYDVKDVLEQYSAGHSEMLARVRQIIGKTTLIESLGQKGLRGQQESKNVLNYRLCKIEDSLRDTETKLNLLVKLQFENKDLFENILSYFDSNANQSIIEINCSKTENNP